MFKRLLATIVALGALSLPAHSQGTVRVCYMSSPTVCTDVSATNPLPVNATVSASITFPTIGAPVPATADYVGINVGGNLTGWTGAVTILDGSDVTEGAKADSACGTDNGTCSIAALIKRGNQNLTTLNTSVGSAVPAGTNLIGYTNPDPCSQVTKINLAISQAASATIITGTSAKKTYICSMVLIAGAAEVINLTAGTGTVCATGGSVVMGSATAANGLSLAANGGLTFGNGLGTIAAATAANADNVCLTQNATSRVSGVITYVQQ